MANPIKLSEVKLFWSFESSCGNICVTTDFIRCKLYKKAIIKTLHAQFTCSQTRLGVRDFNAPVFTARINLAPTTYQQFQSLHAVSLTPTRPVKRSPRVRLVCWYFQSEPHPDGFVSPKYRHSCSFSLIIRLFFELYQHAGPANVQRKANVISDG